MATLIAFPILIILLILQTVIVSQVPLLHGTADLILLTITAWALQKHVRTAWQWGIIGGLLVSFVSALPLGVPLVGYLLVVWFARMLRRRVWQAPILAMFIATFFGTLFVNFLNIFTLRLVGTSFSLVEALNIITLPSVLLNLLLAIPAYALMGDLANWLYPEELEV